MSPEGAKDGRAGVVGAEDGRRRRSGIAGVVAALVHGWAMCGGLALLAVVAVNVVSVIGGVVWAPFPGDFELTEIGVAVAAFAFLPWCQLHDLNVTADIFTARASARWVAGFRLAASIVALGFASLLGWRMRFGLLDQKEYGYTTAILQVPLWWGYAPILISLALLVAAAAVTTAESAARAAGRRGARG